ncbi:hypothetical protein [Pseudonocardia humida]|uniref:Ferredoxin n=1 Tax=Pseudonocardia humida TaxID=2800819 RepID=A0ABT0ZXS0_9PSEU|nr:hypothetical protein [Pseudonocardia humida]MCO1655488.1 hypothetical protein [Pseudonocardia humida]
MSDTAADRREFLGSGLVDVACARCGAGVRVRKTSAEHTSIQWSTAAQRRCEAFALRTGCPALRRSIEDAVESGRLLVG